VRQENECHSVLEQIFLPTFWILSSVPLYCWISKKLVVLLENRSLYLALNFAGQALFRVEALGAGLDRECAVGEAIQWVVVVTAEQVLSVEYMGFAL
jgi:hypothetical protein